MRDSLRISLISITKSMVGQCYKTCNLNWAFNQHIGYCRVFCIQIQQSGRNKYKSFGRMLQLALFQLGFFFLNFFNHHISNRIIWTWKKIIIRNFNKFQFKKYSTKILYYTRYLYHLIFFHRCENHNFQNNHKIYSTGIYHPIYLFIYRNVDISFFSYF